MADCLGRAGVGLALLILAGCQGLEPGPDVLPDRDGKPERPPSLLRTLDGRVFGTEAERDAYLRNTPAAREERDLIALERQRQRMLSGSLAAQQDARRVLGDRAEARRRATREGAARRASDAAGAARRALRQARREEQQALAAGRQAGTADIAGKRRAEAALLRAKAARQRAEQAARRAERAAAARSRPTAPRRAESRSRRDTGVLTPGQPPLRRPPGPDGTEWLDTD